MFRMQFLHLFNTENLSELKHLLINFLRFRQGSSNTVAFNTSLSPSHDLRTLSFHRKITTFLECIEPTVEWDKSDVNITKCLSSEVRLVSKLSFKNLQAVKKHLLAFLLFFSFVVSPNLSSSLKRYLHNGLNHNEKHKQAAQNRGNETETCCS